MEAKFPATLDQGDVKADASKCVLQRCPICGKGFPNHYYARFATTAFAEANRHRMEFFFSSLEQHDWLQAVQFQDWDVLSNNAEAYALKCSTERLALVIIYSPYEVFEDDSLIRLEVLNGNSGERLIACVRPNGWKPVAA